MKAEYLEKGYPYYEGVTGEPRTSVQVPKQWRLMSQILRHQSSNVWVQVNDPQRRPIAALPSVVAVSAGRNNRDALVTLQLVRAKISGLGV